jgi:hypothetical protein
LISDADIQKAVDWLRDSAPKIAKARAEMIYVEEYRKSLKAMLMKEHIDESLGAQEREAYADERYLKHLAAYRDSVAAYELLRAQREAANIRIEAWRSMSANQRVGP